jgi:hypothetical protein
LFSVVVLFKKNWNVDAAAPAVGYALTWKAVVHSPAIFKRYWPAKRRTSPDRQFIVRLNPHIPAFLNLCFNQYNCQRSTGNGAKTLNHIIFDVGYLKQHASRVLIYVRSFSILPDITMPAGNGLNDCFNLTSQHSASDISILSSRPNSNHATNQKNNKKRNYRYLSCVIIISIGNTVFRFQASRAPAFENNKFV